MSDGPVMKLKDVTRVYRQGGRRLDVLCGVDLEIEPGEVLALVGPSGSGKSTLLQIAGLLDTPTSGEVMIGGEDMTDARDHARTMARRKSIGFIYQFHHLLPEFSALENIMLPQMMAGTPPRVARARAHELLGILGLKQRARHRPAALSGGEQQRVAIGRALANNPRLLLADEPTGNLDPHTASEVFAMLMDLARGQGLAALVATHNMDLAWQMDSILRIAEGRVSLGI